MKPTTHHFGPFRLDATSGLLRRGDEEITLQPRILAALALFVGRAGELVTRENLLDTLWPDTIVGDNSVDQVITKLRRALGDEPRAPRYIQTVPRRGFRFVAPVEHGGDGAVASGDLVGRDDVLAWLDATLRDPAVAVLVGPGGIGKSCVATTWAAAQTRRTAAVVELHTCRDDGSVCASVARALGVALTEADPAAQVGAALALRGAFLLVLDAAERVGDGVERLVAQWRRVAPQVAILITSRVPVEVEGAARRTVGPLSPEASRALFTARARAARPSLSLSGVDALTVRLHHHPLAIELVAARCRTFEVADLLRALERGASVARAGDPDPRHGDLERVVADTLALLEPGTRALLDRVEVFARWFTVDGASFVGAGEVVAVDAVETLVAAGLLVVRHDGGTTRFALYDLVREHIRRARTDAERRVAEARHAAYFAGRWTREALAAVAMGAADPEPLDADLDDLVAATTRAVPDTDLVACALAAAASFVRTGPFDAGLVVVDRALARTPGDDADRGRLLAARGALLRHGARSAEAEEALRDAVAMLEGADEQAAARAQVALGEVLRGLGRIDDARAAFDAALDASQRSGDRGAQAVAHGELGALLLEHGVADEAGEHARRGLALAREAGDRVAESRILGVVATWHARGGRDREARRAFSDALAVRRALGDRAGESVLLGNLGNVDVGAGRWGEALSRYGEALAIDRAIGARRHEAAMLVSMGVVLLERGDPVEADGYLQRAAVVAEEVGYDRLRGIAHDNLTLLCLTRGLVDDAVENGRAAVSLAETTGHRRGQGTALGNLAEALVAAGRLDEAAVCLDRGEAILREIGDLYHLCSLLCTRVLWLRARGADPGPVVREAQALLGIGTADWRDGPLATKLERVASESPPAAR